MISPIVPCRYKYRFYPIYLHIVVIANVGYKKSIIYDFREYKFVMLKSILSFSRNQ